MPGPVVSDTIANIHELIARGEVRPGGRLPPERALAEMFCVSRSSVRAALAKMRELGEVEVRRGRRGGYFLASDGLFWRDRGRMEVPRESVLMVGRKVGRLWTLQQELARHGYEAKTEVLSATLERSPVELCRLFGLVDSRSLYRIIRRRSSRDEPISFEQTYFDPQRFPGLLDQDLSQSLLLLAINHYHEKAAEVEEQVEVVAARGNPSKYLKVSPGASLLRVNLFIYDETAKLLLFSHDHYRPDHVRLTIRNRV